MTFGEKLKQARTDAGLKQSELAKIIGTTNTTISNWEKGVSKPDLDMLSYICGALQVTVSYFLQPILPDDEVTIPEFNMIKKYRGLDDHGKDMVDTVLGKEYDRCKTENNIVELVALDKSYLEPVAAHNNNAEDPDQQRLMKEDMQDMEDNW